jgi:hypothetical protein
VNRWRWTYTDTVNGVSATVTKQALGLYVVTVRDTDADAVVGERTFRIATRADEYARQCAGLPESAE